MPFGEPIIINIKKGDHVILERDGNDLKVRIGINDIGVSVKRGDTLVVRGGGIGNSLTVNDDAKFIPRISVETEAPLRIAGSFTTAAESKQIAEVDITPVALTDMKGVDKPRSINKEKDAQTGAQIRVPKYELSTPGKNLKEWGSFDSDLPARARYVEYYKDGKKYMAAVEAQGGRIDFVNGKDGDQRLMTLDGRDLTDTTEMRAKRARNDAMAQVAGVLNRANKQNDTAYVAAKARLGIPLVLEKGDVRISDVGLVNMNIPAAAPVSDFNKPGPITGQASVTGREVNGQPTAEEKKIITDITQRIDAYFGHTKNLLIDNQYPVLGKGQDNLGIQLGNAMREARDTANELINEQTGKVRSQELAQLHAKLDAINDLSSRAYKIVEKDDNGDKEFPTRPAYVASRTRSIRDQFAEFHDRMNHSELLRDNRVTNNTTRETGHDKKGYNKMPIRTGAAYPVHLTPELEAGIPEPKEGLLRRLADAAMKDSAQERLNVSDVDTTDGAPVIPGVSGRKPFNRAG